MIVSQCSKRVFFPNRHGSCRKWCFRLSYPVGAACGQHRTPTWKQWKKWNRVETQHALYSLAQMRDFQTLNLKKRVSLRWRAWIWKRACVSHHRNPKRRKHACVSLQKSKKTWKRTCVSHHNVEQWRKRACVSTLQAASRKKTRNVFKMCFLLHSDTHQLRWTIICVSVTDWKRACVSTQAQQNQMEHACVSMLHCVHLRKRVCVSSRQAVEGRKRVCV